MVRGQLEEFAGFIQEWEASSMPPAGGSGAKLGFFFVLGPKPSCFANMGGRPFKRPKAGTDGLGRLGIVAEWGSRARRLHCGMMESCQNRGVGTPW